MSNRVERKRRKFRNTVEFFTIYVEKHVESVYNYLYCGAVRMKLCKWAGAEAGGGAVKKFKKGLTAESRNGAPSSPQARAKGSTMYNLRRNVRRGFVVTRVPFRQTRFIFCLEVLSHR